MDDLGLTKKRLLVLECMRYIGKKGPYPDIGTAEVMRHHEGS